MNEREIFEKAAEILEPAARKEFLLSACGGNQELHSRIEALLRSHESKTIFLQDSAPEQLSVPGPSSDTSSKTSPDEMSPTLLLPPGSFVSQKRLDDDEDENAPDLSFLSPSTQHGSIGKIGHYEVLQVLGQGGFGTVFKAFDEKLHRVVAIKVMSPQLAATSPARKRFLREARAAASIKNENIVQVYSVEELPLPYLVMEFINGPTLQEKLNGNGPLEVPEVLYLGQQIANGLAAAHALNLVHRDIKPGNVLIEGEIEQKIKITDFGLARAADDASLTRSGMIAGTPMYMAPEQATGQPIDHRTDLFSLGSVLYQMVSGRPPFRASTTVAVLRRVADDTPRALQEIVPEVPDWLVVIINKLLEKKPEDRYQSAKEVTDLLGQCRSEMQQSGKVTSVATPQIRGKVKSKTLPTKEDAASQKANLSRIVYGMFLGALIFLPILFGKQIGSYINPLIWPAIPALPSESIPRGLVFDGKDDYVKFDSIDWSYPQFTIEAFVTSSPESDNGTIVHLTSGGEESEWMSIYDDAQADPGKRLSGTAIKGKTPFANTSAPLTPGVRQHRALVFDGRHMHYYVNGIWQAKRYAEANEGLMWKMKDLRIACDGAERKFFEGQIDQVRISRISRYDKNFAQITRLEKDDLTLALYNFDEGAGDVLKDVSGNGHDGKIFGAKWVKAPSQKDGDPKLLPGIPKTKTSDVPSTSWTNLFDGSKAAGWKTLGPFKVDNGLLKASAGGLAITEKSYDDFELEFDWRIASAGNSGIYYRTDALKLTPNPSFSGTEFQLLDNDQHPDGKNMKTSVGSLYGVLPPEGTFTRPAGEWNTSRIVARGPEVQHWVNNKNVLSYDMNSKEWRQALEVAKNKEIATNVQSRSGCIALQGHTGEIAFRSIRIREIPVADLSGTTSLNTEIPKSQISDQKSRSTNSVASGVITTNDTKDKSMFTPLAQDWIDRVSKLSPEVQVKEFTVDMKRRNPDWDGVVTPEIEGGQVVGITFDSLRVKDLSPIVAFSSLKKLDATSSQPRGELNDLTPLAQIKSLEAVFLNQCEKISDISSLRNLPISVLGIAASSVSDLSPLAGKPIKDLNAVYCQSLTDISPLRGSPLNAFLGLAKSGVTDLTPIRDSSVSAMSFNPDRLVSNWETIKNWPLHYLSSFDSIPVETLRKLRELKTLQSFNGKPVIECLHELDSFVAEMKRCNPEWDGVVKPLISDGKIVEITFDSLHVKDLNPVTIFSSLKNLLANSSKINSELSDLSPLAKLKSLEIVFLSECEMIEDLSPLAELPITALIIQRSRVSDLSPLAGKPIMQLSAEYCESLVDLSPLRGAPLQSYLGLAFSGVIDLSPLRDSQVFHFNYNAIRLESNWDTIKNWPLKHYFCNHKIPAETLRMLQEMKTLEMIDNVPLKEYLEKVGVE